MFLTAVQVQVLKSIVFLGPLSSEEGYRKYRHFTKANNPLSKKEYDSELTKLYKKSFIMTEGGKYLLNLPGYLYLRFVVKKEFK